LLPATFHSWVVANQPYTVTVAGPLGGWAVLAFGELIQPTPTPLGLLSIDPLTAQFTSIVNLPANGTYDWNLFCPSGVPSGVGYAFQCLTLSPGGKLGLTLPSPFTVKWQVGVAP